MAAARTPAKRAMQVRFPLKLGGKGVRTDRIDINDLVPTLNALSEITRVACRIEFGNDDNLRVLGNGDLERCAEIARGWRS